MARICIIDYRRGNLASVHRGLTDAGFDAFISDRAEDVLSADGLLLPGVGSFKDAITFLEQSGQADAIRKRVAQGVPFLGICLGLQLVYEQGNEGCAQGETLPGLGLVPGEVVRMPALMPQGEKVKVPHVGWNSVELVNGGQGNPLFDGIEDGSYFYFTHSFVGVPANKEDVAGITVHAQPFVSAIRHGNVFATQFHPEKSSAVGMRLLANFGRLVEEYSQGGLR
ncbi:MAG: imidazole glycerol phosphate synthase subunit HisH [Coriobacteriia bacterium]|nr:imidazole glycerol phosphate synthase subunit HisH [Coriobacteriia bacterium]